MTLGSQKPRTNGEKFLGMLENYYRDTYPTVMRVKALDIIPENPEFLSKLFSVVIRNVSASYGKVPDVMALEVANREVLERHPQFRIEAYRPDDVLQLTDGSDNELIAEGLAALERCWREKRNPAEDPELIRVNKELGF